MPTKAKIKYLQSLTQKKIRDELNLFVAEGPKVVAEFLRAPNTTPSEIFALRRWLEKNTLPLQNLGCPVTEIDETTLRKLSSQTTPNQVVGVFAKPVFDGSPRFDNKLTLLLDTIQDPGNLGTIIRCADWFGIENVVCSPTCADAFNPKIIQSTMGSIARVRVIYDDLIEVIKKHNLPIYAAALDGYSLYDQQPINKGMLIIGNESKGVGQKLLSLADHHINIPGAGGAESLNAAVATGILLSHLTPR